MSQRAKTSPARTRPHILSPALSLAGRAKQLSNILDLDELRGVPLTTLLGGGAWLFEGGARAARAGSHSTFKLSRSVPRIDYFVSHSWATPRFAKALGLWNFMNGQAAIAAAVVVNLAIFWVSLHRFSALPPWTKWKSPSLVDGSVHEIVLLGSLPVALCVYALVLATAHHLLRRHEYGFLDICCVPQGDKVEQARAIAALGAVTARSERMIICVDEHFWTRLWCIFEVAAFCRHGDISRLVIVPLHTSILELGYAAFFMLVLLTLRLTERSWSVHYDYFVLGFLAQPIINWANQHARRAREALKNLSSFRIDDADCSSEEDRAALVRVIASWYTDPAAGETSPARREELGRHKFEQFVRHDLAPSIQRQVQQASFKRLCLLTFAVALQGPALAMIAAPSVSLAHAAMIMVLFTFISLVMPTLMRLMHNILQPVVWDSLQACRGKLEQTQSMPRVVRVAIQMALYALAFGLFAIPLNVYLGLRHVCVTPNKLLEPEWHPPDDGLDPTSRRHLKHGLVLAWHLLIGLAAGGL